MIRFTYTCLVMTSSQLERKHLCLILCFYRSTQHSAWHIVGAREIFVNACTTTVSERMELKGEIPHVLSVLLVIIFLTLVPGSWELLPKGCGSEGSLSLWEPLSTRKSPLPTFPWRLSASAWLLAGRTFALKSQLRSAALAGARTTLILRSTCTPYKER